MVRAPPGAGPGAVHRTAAGAGPSGGDGGAPVIRPTSKLATARNRQSTTLGSWLGVEDADEDDLSSTLDWLGRSQMQGEA